MHRKDFDYDLPCELIAQYPVPRGRERLMVVERATRRIMHTTFDEFGTWLGSGDCLVLNNTRVIPARLYGKKITGGQVEVLLLKRKDPYTWECLTHASKALRPGSTVTFNHGVTATVEGRIEDRFQLRFNQADVTELLGEIPLPPYISRTVEDRDAADYQTVYACHDGSVAAPTAGLHFTRESLADLQSHGVECVYITLHVGPGTFLPVRTERIAEHHMHAEEFQVDASAAAAINKARGEGRRVVAVGTTTTRVLEHLMRRNGEILAGPGATDLFITPGFVFCGVDALLTNFHLPCSTLLMLVSAFGGFDLIREAYLTAVQERYRFFSYGDAMLIL